MTDLCYQPLLPVCRIPSQWLDAVQCKMSVWQCARACTRQRNMKASGRLNSWWQGNEQVVSERDHFVKISYVETKMTGDTAGITGDTAADAQGTLWEPHGKGSVSGRWENGLLTSRAEYKRDKYHFEGDFRKGIPCGGCQFVCTNVAAGSQAPVAGSHLRSVGLPSLSHAGTYQIRTGLHRMSLCALKPKTQFHVIFLFPSELHAVLGLPLPPLSHSLACYITTLLHAAPDQRGPHREPGSEPNRIIPWSRRRLYRFNRGCAKRPIQCATESPKMLWGIAA